MKKILSKNKFLATVIAVLFLVPAMFMLTACDEKEHKHTLEAVSAIDATCTTDGNVEYNHCTGCNKNFDKDGKEIENVTISAKGHDYGVTGVCSCGENVATTITNESPDENGDFKFTKIVDNKIYFNFTSCGEDCIYVDTYTQQGAIEDSSTLPLIESVVVYKAGESAPVCTLTKSFWKAEDGVDSHSYWMWVSDAKYDENNRWVELENPFYTEANTQYNVVVTLKEHYDEFTIYVEDITMHSYNDCSFVCDECNVLNLNANEVKNAPEMTYDEETGKFTYKGTFEAETYYVVKLTNTSEVVLNNGTCTENQYGVFSANGSLMSDVNVAVDEVVYVVFKYATETTETIVFQHAE